MLIYQTPMQPLAIENDYLKGTTHDTLVVSSIIFVRMITFSGFDRILIVQISYSSAIMCSNIDAY